MTAVTSATPTTDYQGETSTQNTMQTELFKKDKLFCLGWKIKWSFQLGKKETVENLEVHWLFVLFLVSIITKDKW